MNSFKRLSQRGDTIVEVLICLAVFGAMLTAAYALTNRNQAISQSSQERSQAVKVADSQLELLRAYTDDNKLPTYQWFCMNSDAAPVEVSSNPQNSPVGSLPETCRFNSSQNAGRYSYVIYSPDQAVELGGNGSAYAVQVKWEGMIAQDEAVTIFYSIYDTSNPAFATNINPGGDPNQIINAPACSDGRDNDGDGLIDFGRDPGCSSALDTDEQDMVTVSGRLNVSADCYAPTDPNNGCPALVGLFTWSDGSTDPWTAPMTSRNGSFQDLTYSFNKMPGVTLKTLRVNIDSDKYLNSPTTDRNGYIRSLTHQGVSYSHTAAYPTPCAAEAVYYPLAASTKFLCDTRPVTFFMNPAERPRDPCPSTVNSASQVFPSWHLYNTGGTRQVRTFTFTNPANCAPLVTSNVSLSDTTNFSISSNGCSNRTIAAGASCSVSVQFYPPSGAAYNFHRNAGRKSTQITLNNTSQAPATTVSASGMAVSDRLGVGESLRPGEYIKNYETACYNDAERCGSWLTLRTDGNLVMHEKNGSLVWNTGPIGGAQAIMQTDGNFVLYNGAWQPVWYATMVPGFAPQSGDWLMLSTNSSNTATSLLNHKRASGANYYNYYPTGWFY